MKSPKRNLKARSSVASRKSSPGWTAATDLFKSPKSPSPVKRVTRRTSVYQSKKTVESQFKMPPISKVKSPPGVKTRARRSSIYQKGGGRLLSPKNTRARRASMYVSSKAKTETVDVFSKVWATPIRPPTLAETSPEKVESKKASSSKKPLVKQLSPEKPEPIAQQAAKVISPQQKVGKTPRSTKKPATKKQSPAKSAKKSPKPAAKNPSPVKSAKKSPKASAKKPPVAKSAKKSPKMSSPKKSSLKKAIITSTPTKSVEELTGKSFYSTPGETPIANKRTDDVFVFSAMPVKSAKKSTRARKSVVLTPLDTPKKDASITPKRMPVRKTPAVKRSRENESDSSMTSPAVPSPVAKRLRASAKTRSVKTAKRSVKQLPSSTKVPLSPSQMIDVLKSTKRVYKRPASTSPTSRPSKMAKTDQELTTPRVFKTVKRSSPKKLADIVSVSQNTNNNSEEVAQSPTSYTSLNDTINTDSRSGRCVIL